MKKKQCKKQCIYQIKNSNGKVYIGQVCFSKGHLRRWREHKIMLVNNCHYNKHLQCSWNKYGENSFIFEIIEEVKESKNLNLREQHWIDKTWDYNYNIQPIAGSPLGTKRNLSVEAKKNIAKANKNRPWTKEDRDNLSLSLSGIKRSDDFKKRRKEIMLGSKHSEKTKEKISKGNKNKIVSEKTRKKISLSKIGKKQSKHAIMKKSHTVRSKNLYSGSSKFKGVSWKSLKWVATICYKSKNVYLGRFVDETEAAKNYDYYAKNLIGNGCFVNFPNFDYSKFVPKLGIMR